MRTIASLKSIFTLTLIYSLSFSFSIAAPNVLAEEIPPRWEKLGSRKVNFAAEKDAIAVTRYEGRFNAVRLRIEKSDINLHRFVIHYGNGDKQSVNVKKVLKAGTTTRVIDLKGKGRRVIKKVEFWYDTKGYEGKKATVELWGRHF